jgi:hypothetical protein
MFCRFCGAHLLDDSLFCSKCGKRTGRSENPQWERIIKGLRLRTPYPYAIFLIAVVTIWALSPHAAPVDYSNLKWTLSENRKLDLPSESLFQQSFSLVLENAGGKSVKDIPVAFTARIEPQQPADIGVSYRSERTTIMNAGKATPPVMLILSDEVRPGSKRSFLLEGSIQAQPPFKVTYEVREEGTEKVLADFVVER